jgi:hypothetical protein
MTSVATSPTSARTQPTLPLDCGKAEKKIHDYVRHGTTNLFAALNVETGEVFGECRPTRTGQDFLDFLNKAVQLHVDKEIHVVLDNLSTHTTPEVLAWLEKNPHVTFHFTPVGSSWLNQIVRHEVAREQRYSSKEGRLMSMV